MSTLSDREQRLIALRGCAVHRKVEERADVRTAERGVDAIRWQGDRS